MKRFLATLLTLTILLTLGSFSTEPTQAGNKKVAQKVYQELSASPAEPIPVIIQTSAGLNQQHLDKVNAKGGKFKQELNLIKGFSADLPAEAINALAQDPSVKYISYDTPVHVCLDTATQTLAAPTYWSQGLTGKGITVAVVDSGLYPHPDLTQPSNRIIAFKDLVNRYTLPYDDFGHGTHVAGIIAGNGTMSDGLYRGIAPEASLVGVKVVDNTGNGATSTLIAGIEWVIDNKDLYGIDVVNLSLGAPALESYITDPLSQAAQAAVGAGLVVVAAAGNEGPEPGTIRTPGINPNVITVGALDDHGTVATEDDTLADFSSRGPTLDGLTKPDILAPGVEITSLISDPNYLPPKRAKSKRATNLSITLPSSGTYFTASGTSMATPMIAGKAALLLQQNKALTPAQVKASLLAQ